MFSLQPFLYLYFIFCSTYAIGASIVGCWISCINISITETLFSITLASSLSYLCFFPLIKSKALRMFATKHVQYCININDSNSSMNELSLRTYQGQSAILGCGFQLFNCRFHDLISSGEKTDGNSPIATILHLSCIISSLAFRLLQKNHTFLCYNATIDMVTMLIILQLAQGEYPFNLQTNIHEQVRGLDKTKTKQQK